MISEGYVQNGAKVYISSRDAKACDKACQELNALGKGSAHAIPADFYKEADCKKLAEELSKRETSELYQPPGRTTRQDRNCRQDLSSHWTPLNLPTKTHANISTT